MSDVLTPEQRHLCMCRIKGKDTNPEIQVRKYLHAHGYRFRLHEKRLPGKPDIVMKRLHTVIFVNGCFWHGHTLEDGSHCKYFIIPQTRTDFWQAKIVRNQARDKEDVKLLTSMGWNVLQIWECQLKKQSMEKTLKSLLYTLSKIELGLLKNSKSQKDTES